MCANEERSAVDIDTASNSPVEEDADLGTMSDTQKTVKLLAHVRQQRPVSLDGKAPTLDDVRAVIQADFNAAGELWKITAPKKVVSRLLHCLQYS